MKTELNSQQLTELCFVVGAIAAAPARARLILDFSLTLGATCTKSIKSIQRALSAHRGVITKTDLSSVAKKLLRSRSVASKSAGETLEWALHIRACAPERK